MSRCLASSGHFQWPKSNLSFLRLLHTSPLACSCLSSQALLSTASFACGILVAHRTAVEFGCKPLFLEMWSMCFLLPCVFPSPWQHAASSCPERSSVKCAPRVRDSVWLPGIDRTVSFWNLFRLSGRTWWHSFSSEGTSKVPLSRGASCNLACFFHTCIQAVNYLFLCYIECGWIGHEPTYILLVSSGSGLGTWSKQSIPLRDWHPSLPSTCDSINSRRHPRGSSTSASSSFGAYSFTQNSAWWWQRKASLMLQKTNTFVGLCVSACVCVCLSVSLCVDVCGCWNYGYGCDYKK